MTKDRAVLIMKESKKGGVAINYRPIVCLPIMWKLLTQISGDEIYSYLDGSILLQTEQKCCCRGSRGTKHQFLIDKTILRNCRKAKRNLAVRFIDCKEVFGTVPLFLVKRDTKNCGSGRQHAQIIMSEHV